MRTLMLAIISLSAGFIGSLMSGGSIVIFSLLTLLGIPVQSAVGTLKVAIAALTLVSALTYYRGGAVEVKTTTYLVIFSIAGSVAGSYFFASIPEKTAGIVVLPLLFVGIYLSIRGEPEEMPSKSGSASRLRVSGVGFIMGVYIGILGIASTLIVIAALRAFFGMDILKANGTAKAIIFANNLVAALVYGLGGKINGELLLPILIPVCLGAWLGARVALKLGSERLRWVYLVLGSATALKLLSELV